jgi:hypothetical protein
MQLESTRQLRHYTTKLNYKLPESECFIILAQIDFYYGII